jgi:hypothetical protein
MAFLSPTPALADRLSVVTEVKSERHARRSYVQNPGFPGRVMAPHAGFLSVVSLALETPCQGSAVLVCPMPGADG